MTSSDEDNDLAESGFELPFLRKAISEPALAAAEGSGDLFKALPGHQTTTQPRLVVSGGAAPRHRHQTLGPADTVTQFQPPQQQQQNATVTTANGLGLGDGVGDATRSIDMINLHNFPAVMTKHILRRRAYTADSHTVRARVASQSRAPENGTAFVANKYNEKLNKNQPGSHGAGRGKLAPRTPNATGHQETNRPKMVYPPGHHHHHHLQVGVSLPPRAHMPHPRPTNGEHQVDGRSEVSGCFPVIGSDFHGGRSSVGSWQTYPLSTRLCHNYPGLSYARGERRVGHAHVIIPENNPLPVSTSNRIRSRFTAPPHAHRLTQDSRPATGEKADRSNTEQGQLSELRSPTVVVNKPTKELLRRKRTLGANDDGHRNKRDEADSDEDEDSDDENANLRVRRWLSSLDNTVCQRYARRQMASLREYETSNSSAT